MRPVDAGNQSIEQLISALEAVQNHLRQLEGDFQSRLEQAVQQAEARLQEQFLEKRRQETKQTEEDVRKNVTRDLLVRFEVEFNKLNTDFENRRRQAIDATEAAAEFQFKQAIEEAERARDDLKRDFDLASKDWEAQREKLRQRIAELELDVAANRVVQAQEANAAMLESKLAEISQQRSRLEEELQDAKEKWSSERNSLKAEAEQARQELIQRYDQQINQMKAEFEDRRAKAEAAAESAADIRHGQILAEAKQEFERREKDLQEAAAQSLENANNRFEAERKELIDRNNEVHTKLNESIGERAKLEQEFQAASTRWEAERKELESKPAPIVDSGPAASEAEKAEIQRVEARIREISEKIEASVDLGAEIRLNRERSELEAYLKGLQFK